MDHDIKSLFSKLNDPSTNVLHNAVGLCVSRTNYEITVEQFLLKSLEETSGDIQVILRHFEIDPTRLTSGLTDALEDQKAGNPGKPTFSPLLMELFEKAWMITSIDLGGRRIRTGAVLMAFLTKPTFFGGGRYVDLLKNINTETLQKNFWKITEGSTEQESAGPADAGAGEGAPAASGDGYLAKYCEDFTAKAASGDIDPVFGREEEIHQIIDVLARRRKNNPILVGEPGVGKTAVIEGLALRISEGDVPDMLKNVTLLGLDMGALEAGAGMKGEFENRLKGVLSEIKASETPIILFIDEAHTLIGAGGSAGSSDAANLLKPALARGEIKTCAATTWSEYKKYFEKDPALARRFQLIKLAEPDVSIATLILRGLKDNYEASHNVIVRDDAIVAAAEYADRYISGRFLPDKAIDLLDTSCARIKINLTAKPPALTDAERARQALEREKRALDRDRDNGIAIDEEYYADLLGRIETRGEQIESITARWEDEKERAGKVVDLRQQLQTLSNPGDAAQKEELNRQLEEAGAALAGLQADDPMVRIEVCPDVVSKVVSDWTGVPLGKIQRDQVQTVINFEDRLSERIKGQDHAISAIGEVIKSAKSGIRNPDQPLGVFLLVGPSGVGKTETGLGIADLLFGGEHNIVTINMSEFQERHSTSRLIGSPPGYVGYGEGGMLSEAVRQNPYSVVLLDEVEKAHPDVMNLFYQVFDKGTLSDGEGKDINFKNTVLILTSNLATDVIQEMTHGEDEVPPMEAVMGAVRPLLSKHFKPALLARMSVVPYYSLDTDAMARVVGLKLAKLQKTMQQNNKIELTYSDDVVKQITDRCAEVETGARNIDYILQGKVMPEISQTILKGMGAGGEMPGTVSLSTGEQGEFKVEFA